MICFKIHDVAYNQTLDHLMQFEYGKALELKRDLEEVDREYLEDSDYLIFKYDLSPSYNRIYSKSLHKQLLDSGMFFEFHPELTGDWDKDQHKIWIFNSIIA